MRPHVTTWERTKGFSRNFYWGILLKCVNKFNFLLKPDNDGYFSRSPTYIFIRIWSVIRQIYSNIYFPRKSRENETRFIIIYFPTSFTVFVKIKSDRTRQNYYALCVFPNLLDNGIATKRDWWMNDWRSNMLFAPRCFELRVWLPDSLMEHVSNHRVSDWCDCVPVRLNNNGLELDSSQ
jgi:hypothetical protein